ncbi:GntR family transcriptional regulator (plasmid) [Streptosporangium sp. CA-135522]|uniref:GntR family transcriptional regulator n=1 Tax=Streptosporangium sp. CA-135522 TaxID=3240072 RepID=UPI003D94C6EF
MIYFDRVTPMGCCQWITTSVLLEGKVGSHGASCGKKVPPGMVAKHRQIAEDLRAAIRSGEYPPGSPLPSHLELVERYGVSRSTVNTALGFLEAERLTRGVPGQGVFVLEWRPVRVAVSRYAAVLEPGGQLGPWETACQQAGVNGAMVTIGVDCVLASVEVAAALGLGEGAQVIRRSRHAMIDRMPVQLHTAFYPADLVEGTPLAGTAKVVGGVYAAMRAAGFLPAAADEKVSTRPADHDEAAQLGLRQGTPVLTVDRVTRDESRRPLEYLRMIIDPHRIELLYDDLPLTRS